MKLESLLNRLDNLRAAAENDEFQREVMTHLIIVDLLEYIGNPKVSEAVDEIIF